MIDFTNKIIGDSLTFDDVLVVPAYSEILPREVTTTTKLTRELSINIPIVSAAMDTVTESGLAIVLAQVGGIGILHKNMSIEKQALEVRRVKRSESGMILDPITLSPEDTIGTALAIMKENRIGGIPIVSPGKLLIGILTNRDLRFEHNHERLVKDVMTTENLITAPAGTTLQGAEEILKQYRIEKLPVVDKHGVITGLITYKDILKHSDNPLANKDSLGRLMVGAAVGIKAETLDRVEALVQAGVDVITIDTAHGHSMYVAQELKRVKAQFPDLQIIVGNVATGAAAKHLVDAGADAVKVGVGPGSICTTRIIAGIGVPQLTAIMDTAQALNGTGVPIIADGGIRYSGDIVKAIVAGASTIMAGSMFAGVQESPGETIIYEGRKVKSYRGMGSIEAMKQGSKDRYFQDAEEEIAKLVPEGIVGIVPFKGSLKEIVYQHIGGLKAGMGYCGARTIEDLQKAQFVRISGAGVRESHPHDITITKEAPNYSR